MDDKFIDCCCMVCWMDQWMNNGSLDKWIYGSLGTYMNG